MTYYEVDPRRTPYRRAARALVDEGLRAYKQRVYGCMAGGLTLTGIVAYAAAVSGYYQSIAGTPPSPARR